MPRLSHRLRRLPMLAAAVSLGLAAAPAQAAAADCVVGPTQQSFIGFGDTAWYFLAPGGSFEGSLTWANAGSAEIVAGNEPFNLAGIGHMSSLRLPSGSSVTTQLCVTRDMPHLRFMAKATGRGQLHVKVRVRGPDGKVTDSSRDSLAPRDHRAWAPSRAVDLKTYDLPVGHTGLVDVRFRSHGDWLVDDVLVDPYGRG